MSHAALRFTERTGIKLNRAQAEMLPKRVVQQAIKMFGRVPMSSWALEAKHHGNTLCHFIGEGARLSTVLSAEQAPMAALYGTWNI